VSALQETGPGELGVVDEGGPNHPSATAYYGELRGHVGEALWMALPSIRRVALTLLFAALVAFGIATTPLDALRDEVSLIVSPNRVPSAYEAQGSDAATRCLSQLTTASAAVLGIVVGILGSALIAIFVYAQIANARGLRRVVSALTNPFGIVLLLALHAATLSLALVILGSSVRLAAYCAGQLLHITLIMTLATFLSTVVVGFSQAENLSLLLAMNKACRRINSRHAHLFGRATVTPARRGGQQYWLADLTRLAHGRGRDDFLGPAHDVLTEVNALNDRVLFMKALRCIYRRVAIERGRELHVSRWRTPKRLSGGRVPLGARTWERGWYRRRLLHPRALRRNRRIVQDLELCIIVVDYMIRRSRNLRRAASVGRNRGRQDKLRHQFAWPMLDFACTLSYDRKNAPLVDIVLYGLFYLEREFRRETADGDQEPLRLAGTLYVRMVDSGMREQAESLCDILTFVGSCGDHLAGNRRDQLDKWLRRAAEGRGQPVLYGVDFSLQMSMAGIRAQRVGHDAALVSLGRRIQNPWRKERRQPTRRHST
jgi:hypothetical protein